MRVLHEVDAGRVDVVVRGLGVGKLGRDLVERPLPEVAGEGQHVRLVHEGDVATFAGLRQLERVPDTPFDTHPGVDRTLRGDLVRRSLPEHPALPHVRALGVLADHDEVVGAVEPWSGADEGPLVDVQVELEAHLEQQTALDHAGRNVGCADRAEQDRVVRPQRLEGLVTQDLTVAQVARATKVEVGRVEVDTCGSHDLERFGRDLGADPVATDDCDLVCHGRRI